MGTEWQAVASALLVARILAFGQTGVGKSTTLNCILGKPPGQGPFKTSGRLRACTSADQVEHADVNVDGVSFRLDVKDTIGFAAGGEAEDRRLHSRNIADNIKAPSQPVNAVVCVHSSGDRAPGHWMDVHVSVFSSLPEGNEHNYHIVLTKHHMDATSMANRQKSLSVRSEAEARHAIANELFDLGAARGIPRERFQKLWPNNIHFVDWLPAPADEHHTTAARDGMLRAFYRSPPINHAAAMRLVTQLPGQELQDNKERIERLNNAPVPISNEGGEEISTDNWMTVRGFMDRLGRGRFTAVATRNALIGAFKANILLVLLGVNDIQLRIEEFSHAAATPKLEFWNHDSAQAAYRFDVGEDIAVRTVRIEVMVATQLDDIVGRFKQVAKATKDIMKEIPYAPRLK